MTRARRLLALAAAVAATAALARGQDPPAKPPEWVAESNLTQSLVRDDHREWHFFGGFRFAVPGLGLSIRGGNALVLTDLEESPARPPTAGDDGLRRAPPAPPARRRVDDAE
ncbi:MAG: hypothetical protein ACK58X_03150, partial [Planctomycetota bacterium]